MNIMRIPQREESARENESGAGCAGLWKEGR